MRRVRGLERPLSVVEPDTARALQLARNGHKDSAFAPGAAGNAPLSGAWGMPGPAAPSGMNQPMGASPEPVAEPEAAPAESEEKEA